jgi:hypothetical protein
LFECLNVEWILFYSLAFDGRPWKTSEQCHSPNYAVWSLVSMTTRCPLLINDENMGQITSSMDGKRNVAACSAIEGLVVWRQSGGIIVTAVALSQINAP